MRVTCEHSRTRQVSTGVGVIDTGQLIAEHYRLTEHVGSGAMGVVWKAIDVRLERPVAVKQIITQPGLSEEEKLNIRQRAMREAKNAARLQHPNAIVVFDIAEHAGEPCLVMEYMAGRSLSALLAERGTLPIPEVARMGEQVADALVAAHRAGLVHRDVKPGNVLLDETGTAKLTDFGISRAAGDMTLTQTGLIGGTPAYLAPELARGADPAPSSDVFALGATLYHAIEGKPVYGESENQLALLYAAASGKIVPPAQAGRATALLMSLLRPEPQDRPTMEQTRAQLAILAGNGNGAGNAAPLLAPAPAEQPAGPPPAGGNGDGRPPWQRTEVASTPPAAAAASGPPQPPPRTSTASFEPVQHTAVAPDAPPPSPPPRTAATPSGGEGRTDKRKPIIVGSAIAAVVLIAAVVSIVLTSGGDGSEQLPQAGGATTPTAPPNTSSGSTVADSSSEPVEWEPAGNLVIDFYFSAGSSKAWNMLSRQMQQEYGSQQKFAAVWADFEVQGVGRAMAHERKNNPDGSVDIKVHDLVTGTGKVEPVVTVGKINGELRIVSDPRLDGED